MINVSFRITERARALLRRHCSGSEHGELVPEIIWGQETGPPYDGKWIIGYHSRKVWDDASVEWKLSIDGEDFLISAPHPGRLPLLNDAVLDVDPTGKSLEFKLPE